MIASDIQWWCSARGEAWTWQWRPYPGVWLAVLGVGWWIAAQQRKVAPSTIERASGIVTVLLLWATLDWPIGPLGAGYLASVHTVQFVSLAIVAPPLLLVAIRGSLRAAMGERDAAAGGWRALLTQPIVVGTLFTVVVFVTHAPRVVDTLMRRQTGAFALDLAWFASGVMFWWPVIVRRPARPWFNPLVQMLYVFFGTQSHLGIGMWLLIAQFPAYATYELSPRVTRFSALEDQQLAGALMISLVEPIALAAITILFFRWYGAADRAERAERAAALPDGELAGRG